MFDWNEREILRYMGHRGQEVPDQIRQLIEECKAELEEYAQPRSIWRSYPLVVSGQAIDAGSLWTSSKSLAQNLAGCEAVILFAATLGSRVDLLLQRYGRLQVSKAVVMQAASVAMLETYCDQVNEELRIRYQQQSQHLRPRFSPGYGDFPLECQTQIAAALEMSKRIGITLTDSLLMAPSKSVTAVIGISRTAADCSPRGCVNCQKAECEYRK
ncbi:MAG: vitamin B12 dependent-methionine synthase activation domain-containing protein [Lachnospiraceae bacterium]